MTFDEFKECVKIQAGLDLEVWDVAFVQPLKDLSAWWERQSTNTKSWTTFLAGTSLGAFTRWIARAAGLAAATEVVGLFSEALVAVAAGLALGTFLDIVGRCGIQAVTE
jgi:hypothetical protein